MPPLALVLRMCRDCDSHLFAQRCGSFIAQWPSTPGSPMVSIARWPSHPRTYPRIAPRFRHLQREPRGLPLNLPPATVEARRWTGRRPGVQQPSQTQAWRGGLHAPRQKYDPAPKPRAFLDFCLICQDFLGLIPAGFDGLDDPACPVVPRVNRPLTLDSK
jgi:hypothetical protein